MSKQILENGTTYVRWTALIFMIGILVTVLGVMWAETKGISEDSQKNRNDITEVKNDVQWIREILEKLESQNLTIRDYE